MSDIESFIQRNSVSVDDMIAFENGSLSQEDTIVMFQKLINTGLAWRLQGFYGRTASALIGGGLCKESTNET